MKAWLQGGCIDIYTIPRENRCSMEAPFFVDIATDGIGDIATDGVDDIATESRCSMRAGLPVPSSPYCSAAAVKGPAG